ncbi:MAG: HNH endonuclease [Nitrospirota bacterium]|nr:HNH endonuclease [Nitrospirota bacterium]
MSATGKSGDRWSHDHLKLAFHLYCQIPFGKLHSRNPEIVHLSRLIGRTANSVAMKLVNFASLDPAITNSGRAGLGNASSLDREIWDEFHSDWDRLALECAGLYSLLRKTHGEPEPSDLPPADEGEFGEFTGESRDVITKQRIRQQFFRRTVLSSYQNRCCMSGISEPRLLIASHIVPWHEDKANRLNPRNGLCLSAIHDRAFDQYLISLTDDLHVLVGESIKRRAKEPLISQAFVQLEGRRITLPDRFLPDARFISKHRLLFESSGQ